MQTVDDEPFETIHLYIVREEAARPSLLPIILALLTLLILLVVCITSTPEQPEEHKTIRIPAVFLPLQTFNSAVPIVPTGIKHISATAAKGFLTIYNGSIFSQQIPADMIFVGNDRIEVVVDKSADIPAGNPPYYGTAVVSAHAIAAGAKGNIQALDINEVFGSSLYIRNLQSFTGGMDAFSVKIETRQDRQTALDAARVILTTQEAKIKAFLAYPCKDTAQVKNSVLRLFWACQFVTYTVPSYMKVTHVTLVGKTLLVDVMFVQRPRIIEFK